MNNPVEASIDLLAALQEIDCRQRERTDLVHALQREVAELENQLQLQREATRTAQAQRDAVAGRRRELETRLEDEEGKMTDRRMRLNRVRNEKELQAIRREIEVSKEANQLVEEELLGIFEALDALNAAATEAEGTLRDLEAAAGTRMAEHRARVTGLLAEIAGERDVRERLARTIDANLRQKYEQIFERRGGTAVVEVRSGTCLGCHMNLPPQLFNELQRTREVRQCPNCFRILYWRPERLDPAETPR